MKSYRQFIKESEEDPFYICKKFGIVNFTINSDESIDVRDDVMLNRSSLFKLPLKFGKVSGNFHCESNYLTSLEGCPSEVGGDFDCSGNKLTSLEGCPKIIRGNFYCENNFLTTLEGCPEKVYNFHCYKNRLTSLVGCPEILDTYFNCEDNLLMDFRGISEFFEGQLNCKSNPIVEIWSLFKKDVRCIKLINEFDVIQGGVVILDRLEEVFHQLGLVVPENINLPSYEIQ